MVLYYVNNNSPIQDYVHPNDQTQPTFEMTPGFKPFTVIYIYCLCFNMVSFRGQKKAWATPRSVSFRGLIQNFRRAFPPLSYAESPPPPVETLAYGFTVLYREAAQTALHKLTELSSFRLDH